MITIDQLFKAMPERLRKKVSLDDLKQTINNLNPKPVVRICGRDCHQGDDKCNGYCIGKADSPAMLTEEDHHNRICRHHADMAKAISDTTDTPKLACGTLVRPEFVAQMEAELQANQHKGDWRRWYPTPLQVLAEIQHHQGKLMLALSAGDCERVKEYSADLANFAMKVDEHFGGQNNQTQVTRD